MTLSWISIVRLGLVQAAIGAVIVLTTSTLNRVMVVELALPAALPGVLVAIHYAVQVSRPEWGRRSDAGGRRTPWILRGMAALAAGGVLAALAVALMAQATAAGIALAVLAFMLVGGGAGAAGTSVLALLASGTAPRRRAAAATITWLMMIAGIALTAAGVGAALDPYSHARLLAVIAIVAAGACLLTVAAAHGVERRLPPPPPAPGPHPALAETLRQVWAEAPARRFTVFVFVSMIAYFMQELILEPYAGHVFAYTPGQSTSLSGIQNGGVFAGMLVVGIAATGLRLGSLRGWTTGGCLASAAALAAVAGLGAQGPGAPLGAAVFALGVANGVFAVAAIGSMMQLAGQGRARRDGARMGLWGAAQAMAAGLGGLAGAALVDLARLGLPTADAYAAVFLAEALLFLVAARLALGIAAAPAPARAAPILPGE